LGDLNVNSINFLNALFSNGTTSLNKLILKFQKHQINIKAKDFDLIIKALNMQINLSNTIFQTIHCYLQDTSINSLANVLIKRADDLEREVPTIDTLKSILTVVDSLQIFANSTFDDKFIRAILILMLNFHVKQHNNNHNNYLDSAKWLKTLLSISEKSNLIQLIDYIAIRLSIANINIYGEVSNIELTEIFFSIEELAYSKEPENYSNNKLIKTINACILVSIVCNKNPLAFVDVVASQINDDKSNLPLLTKKIFKQNSQLTKFTEHANYKFYFKNTEELIDLNMQAFLMCFSNLLHEELTSKIYEHKSEIALIKNFIIKCNHNSEKMLDDEYSIFISKQHIEAKIVEFFINFTLETILNKLKDSVKNAIGLNFIANKLTTLGFTPRSNNFARLGMFVPIINKNKFKIDYENMLALAFYVNNLDAANKSLIIKELFVSLLMRYRANPYKLENQPRPFHTKQPNNCYQSLIRHNTKLHNISSRESAHNTKYQFTFFVNKTFTNRKPFPNPRNLSLIDIENNIMIR